MHNIARRSEQERRELFRAIAQAMHVHEAIIEKDFWVCWVLDYLFQNSLWNAESGGLQNEVLPVCLG